MSNTKLPLGQYECPNSPDTHGRIVMFILSRGVWCQCGKAMAFVRGLNRREQTEYDRDMLRADREAA